MIRASKITTGVAALIIGLGLAATWALPNVPPTPPGGTGTPPDVVARRRRRGAPDPTG
jgi:hypothetical protein